MGCVQKDAFPEIQQKIHAAHGVVLGSPNYIFNASAQMKAFMDRCSSMVHCLGVYGKYGASVVTSGGGDEEAIAEYLNHFLMITGSQSVGSLWATMGLIFGNDFPEDISSRALDLGKRLVQAWRNQHAQGWYNERGVCPGSLPAADVPLRYRHFHPHLGKTPGTILSSPGRYRFPGTVGRPGKVGGPADRRGHR
jgi:hypothetical protein